MTTLYRRYAYRRANRRILTCLAIMGLSLLVILLAAGPLSGTALAQELTPDPAIQPVESVDNFADLLPLDAATITKTVHLAFPDLRPASPEIRNGALDADAKSAALTQVSVPQGQDVGISFNQDLVGVVIEAGTFVQPVDLSMIMLAHGEDRPLLPLLRQDLGEDSPIIYDEGQTALPSSWRSWTPPAEPA